MGLPLNRLLVWGVLMFLAASAGAAEAPLRIVTEELPPYNMTQNGRMTGMSTEVVQAVLKEVGMDAPIHSMPWARAYELALNESNVLIYSIVRTPAREPLFPVGRQHRPDAVVPLLAGGPAGETRLAGRCPWSPDRHGQSGRG
nr:hypothetical protein GCM10020185_83040 [Pseudomonas brassicacearum subsp. brassicacearum]